MRAVAAVCFVAAAACSERALAIPDPSDRAAEGADRWEETPCPYRWPTVDGGVVTWSGGGGVVTWTLDRHDDHFSQVRRYWKVRAADGTLDERWEAINMNGCPTYVYRGAIRDGTKTEDYFPETPSSLRAGTGRFAEMYGPDGYWDARFLDAFAFAGRTREDCFQLDVRGEVIPDHGAPTPISMKERVVERHDVYCLGEGLVRRTVDGVTLEQASRSF